MEIVSKIVGIIVLAIVLGLVLALPTWFLWNGCLVPAIDGVHDITWMQAWGIQVLVASLFRVNANSKG